MKACVVTGASGFVGRAVVAALAQNGTPVRALVRRREGVWPAGVEVIDGVDLEKSVHWPILLREAASVIHLAGIAHITDGVSPELYDLVNHRATAALARAARAASVERLVFVSSIRAQTGAVADHVLSEDDVPAPTDPYGRSKLAAEAAIRDCEIAHTILRPVLVYGPGHKGNLAALGRLAKLPIPLPFAGLTNRRSLVSLDNLVNAITFALQSAATRNATFIVADPTPIAVDALVAAMREGHRRKRWLFAIPSSVMSAMRRLGLGPRWERMSGELVASPERLMSVGWMPIDDTYNQLRAVSCS